MVEVQFEFEWFEYFFFFNVSYVVHVLEVGNDEL